jgi:hypothetical protein
MDAPAQAELDGDLLALPETMVETLACHDALQRLGFAREDIYVLLSPVANPQHALLSRGLRLGDLIVFVVLKAQDKEYSIGVGSIEEEGFEDLWAKSIVLWNDATQAARGELWERSEIRARVSELLMHLVERGFRFPTVDRKMLS